MKKITILISGMLLLGITGCETTKAEQGGGLIDPMSSQKTTVTRIVPLMMNDAKPAAD